MNSKIGYFYNIHTIFNCYFRQRKALKIYAILQNILHAYYLNLFYFDIYQYLH